MKQTAEITLETKETLVISQSGLTELRSCPKCNDIVEMVAPYVIAVVSAFTEREIFRFVESDLVYSFESDRLRVCLGCLQTQRRTLCEK